MAELAVFARAHPVDDEASSKKAQRSTSEIRQYRVVGHRKSHAERGCFECNLFLKVYFKYAGVAELADALALGASVTDVQVQVLSPAPKILFTQVGGIFTSYLLPLNSYLVSSSLRDFGEVRSNM